MSSHSKKIISALIYLAGAFFMLILLAIDTNEYAWMANELPDSPLPEDADSTMRIAIAATPVALCAVMALVTGFTFWQRTGRIFAFMVATAILTVITFKFMGIL